MSGRISRFEIGEAAIYGEKHLIDASVPASKLEAGAIKFYVPLQLIKDADGLAADSTGVKYASGKFKLDATNLKSAVIRATWTASETDSVTAIELYDETAGSIVGSVSGNTGTDVESLNMASLIVSEHLYMLRVTVPTASATAGATTSVDYAVLELLEAVS